MQKEGGEKKRKTLEAFRKVLYRLRMGSREKEQDREEDST